MIEVNSILISEGEREGGGKKRKIDSKRKNDWKKNYKEEKKKWKKINQMGHIWFGVPYYSEKNQLKNEKDLRFVREKKNSGPLKSLKGITMQ